MCESKSGSDYINASFVNVSDDVHTSAKFKWFRHTRAKFKWFGSTLMFVYLHRVTSREMPT